MPLFEKPPLSSLPYSRDRWTPLYLEHGRIEIDDSSIKWIGANRIVFSIPVSALSAILLGPGTVITHAAVKACSDSNTPIFWVGEESLRFYASGLSFTHDNTNTKLHAKTWASRKHKIFIARRLFEKRFPNIDVRTKTVPELRGMEGIRVKNLYASLGEKYGVTWKGRKYDKNNWFLADNINKIISQNNSTLYGLVCSVVCSLGFLPTLGFIHETGALPFIYDIADLYKAQTSIESAFLAIQQTLQDDNEMVRTLFKESIEKHQVLKNMPDDILKLFQDLSNDSTNN